MDHSEERESLLLVQELLQESPESRCGLLEARCARKPRLKRRVELLLEFSETDEVFPVIELRPQPRALVSSSQFEGVRTVLELRTVASAGELADRIGPYLLLEEIGRGGMGIVYEAEQPKPHRRVALKCLHPEASWSEKALGRFDREAEFLSRLDHPGIARVFDAGTTQVGDRLVPYIAMELVAGEPLLDHLSETDPTLTKRLELIAQIADSIHAAHLKQIVHRDLKPDNILVAQGSPKILDFGISFSTEAEEHLARQTAPFTILGTLDYMSPEQAVGDIARVDVRSDIYSLGLVAFEVLSEIKAVDTSGQTPLAALQRVTTGDVPSLSSVLPNVDKDVAAIVGKACRAKPEDRYDSASDLRDDIQRYLTHRPVTARQPSVLYRMGRFVRRNRAVSVASSLSVAALLAGIVGTSLGLVRANDRARERDDVASFMESIFDEVDAEAVGREIFRAIEVDWRKALVAEGLPQAQVDANLAHLARASSDVGSLGIARTAVRRAFLDRSSERAREEFADQPLLQATLLLVLANLHSKFGLLAEAQEFQERALSIRRDRLGEEALETLSAEGEYARTLLIQGHPAEACESMEHVLSGQRRALGNEDERTLTSMIRLAAIYRRLGDLDLAQSLLEEAVSGRVRVLGPDHVGTLMATSKLAINLHHQDELAAARAMLEKVLTKLEKQAGPSASSTLEVMMYLATTLQSSGEWEAAVDLGEQLFERQRARLGLDHQDTWQSMGNLAVSLATVGELERSLRLEEQVLERREAIWGAEHPSVLEAKSNIAMTRYERGDRREAIIGIEEAYVGWRNRLGADHADSRRTARNIALMMLQTGDLDGAQRYASLAISGSHDALNFDDTSSLRDAELLAQIYLAREDYSEAQVLLRQLVEARSQSLPPKHPLTLHSIHLLGTSLEGLGEVAAAEECFRLVIDGARESLPSDHPYTIAYLQSLGSLLYDRGDFAEAAPLLVSAHAVARLQGEREQASMQSLAGELQELYSSWFSVSNDSQHEAAAREWGARAADDDA